MHMSRFYNENGKLYYLYDCEKLCIEPWGDNSLRVRATKNAEMPQENWALLELGGTAQIGISEDGAWIKNGKLKAEITSAGKLTFFNQIGKVLLSEYVRNWNDPKRSYSSALGIEAREYKPIIGGDYRITLRFESMSDDKKIFGMGQYQQQQLNLKGCELELAQRNSQASVPFALSSLGYGFLWNNPAVGRVTFGKNITLWQAESSKCIDYWVAAGDTPAEIEEAYSCATGRVPVMPYFATGFWQSKLRYQTQEELLTVAREYKKRNLPISVIVADYFHWPLQGEWKFDPDYWPDPDAMIKELQEMGIELMVSIWPTVDYRSENFEEMRQKGFLIRSEKGIRISMDFQGNTIHYDSTNPGARAYLWQKAKTNYYDKGVRTFWLDEAEPEYAVYDFDNYRYFLGPNVQVGNIYPLMYAKTFYDGMTEEKQQGIINLVRCAWAGSQRYGALVWSGDINSTFESLRNQLTAGLNMGIAGIPWWTTDIGGFHGGNPDDPAFRELLIRWFQWGTFCPVMRLHGDRVPKKPKFGTTGGADCMSGADNEVWSYGQDAYDICCKYLAVRERIRPYVMELAKQAHETGAPMMRPLFYEFPKDEIAWECSDEYMFGPSLLVAPVMQLGMASRNVYLPSGAKWMNALTGEKFSGGETVVVKTSLDVIPIFLRDSARIPVF